MFKIEHQLAAYLYPQTEAERAALRASIQAHGILDPIKVTPDMVVLDGHNRLAVARELGIPELTVPYQVVTTDDPKAWMQQFHAGKRAQSRDRAIAWAVVSGQPIPPELTREGASAVTRARELYAAGALGPVLDGSMTIRMAYARLRAASRPARPKAARPQAPRATVPQGPSTAPYVIPEGHELQARSTLVKDGVPVAAWDKTRVASAGPVVEPIPEDHLIIKRSTYFGADGSVRGQHVTVKPEEAARERLMVEAWERHASVYAGLAGVTRAPDPGTTDEELLTLYPLGDPHIGLLAWAPESGDHHDLAIGTRELVATVRGLVDRAPPSRVGIVANLGDFLHAQDDSNVTPGHGNKLDVEGRHAKVLDAGHACLRAIVDAALAKHERVIVINLPGNHDPRVAAELAMWLRAVYEKEPRVTVRDAFRAHQYERHGCVLLGFHHGDRCKPGELPAIMATDRAQDWGETTERVWHCGHVHHLTRHETPGCVVETHRTMAGADAWHAGKYRAGRSLCAITYHARFGEEARATVSLARVRAAMRRVDK